MRLTICNTQDMTTTQNTTPAPIITVTYDYRVGPTSPDAYMVWGVYATEEERDAALAGFAKNLKVHAVTNHNPNGTQYAIAANGSLKAKQGNPVNETAQRRLSALLDLIQYGKGNIRNAYATAEEARAACLGV